MSIDRSIDDYSTSLNTVQRISKNVSLNTLELRLFRASNRLSQLSTAFLLYLQYSHCQSGGNSIKDRYFSSLSSSPSFVSSKSAECSVCSRRIPWPWANSHMESSEMLIVRLKYPSINRSIIFFSAAPIYFTSCNGLADGALCTNNPCAVLISDFYRMKKIENVNGVVSPPSSFPLWLLWLFRRTMIRFIVWSRWEQDRIRDRLNQVL